MKEILKKLNEILKKLNEIINIESLVELTTKGKQDMLKQGESLGDDIWWYPNKDNSLIAFFMRENNEIISYITIDNSKYCDVYEVGNAWTHDNYRKSGCFSKILKKILKYEKYLISDLEMSNSAIRVFNDMLTNSKIFSLALYDIENKKRIDYNQKIPIYDISTNLPNPVAKNNENENWAWIIRLKGNI